MKEKFFRYKVISAVFGASFALVFGAMLWAFLALRGLPSPIILHYNPLVFINQFGSMWDLLGVGVAALMILALNFAIALELKDREWLLGELTALASLFMSALLFIAFSAIISVN